jgi:tetratricopeptide (TPR) repeat protein
LDSKLREIAFNYKELHPRLKGEAKQSIDAGNYTKAEDLLEDIARQHNSLAAAEAYADNARLQRVRLRYEKAAAYWQKAAALLPEDKKKASYLNSAGYDLKRIYNYKDALHLYEQSLTIRQEIGDRLGEGLALNNIGKIYKTLRDYNIALSYLKQSLVIRQEIGDKEGDAITSYNIGRVYSKQNDLVKAEQYLSRSVQLAEEIGHPSREKYRKALEEVRAKLKAQ